MRMVNREQTRASNELIERIVANAVDGDLSAEDIRMHLDSCMETQKLAGGRYSEREVAEAMLYRGPYSKSKLKTGKGDK